MFDVNEGRPVRPPFAALWDDFHTRFKQSFTVSTGLILLLLGSLVVLTLTPTDLGWVAALATSSLGVLWGAAQAIYPPIRNLMRWRQSVKLFDAPAAVEDRRRTAHELRIAELEKVRVAREAELTKRRLYVQQVSELLEGLRQEERSCFDYVGFPQYGDLRTWATPTGYISLTSSRLKLKSPIIDRATAPPIIDEPLLEAFLVRGEGMANGHTNYSQEHRDSQRIWKRQIFRQEVATFRALRAEAQAALDEQQKAIGLLVGELEKPKPLPPS